MFPEEQCGLSQSLRAIYREHCLKIDSSKARYKDISIMQMNGIFSVGEGSSGPQLPLLVALTTFLVHNKFLVIVMD